MTLKNTLGKLIAIAVFAAITSSSFASVYSSTTSADIWVYPFTSPASTLRVWGDGTNSMAPTFPYLNTSYAHLFSYSYVGWDLSSISDGDYVITSATLTLTQLANCGYTLSKGQENPVEARVLNQYINDPTWNFSAPGNQNPGGIYGVGNMANYSETAQFSIVVDLLAGAENFQSNFNTAVNGNNQIAIALTSTMLADQNVLNVPYKFWSKDDLGYESYAPLLQVEYTAVPEPGSIMAVLAGGIALLPLLRKRKNNR